MRRKSDSHISQLDFIQILKAFQNILCPILSSHPPKIKKVELAVVVKRGVWSIFLTTSIYGIVCKMLEDVCNAYGISRRECIQIIAYPNLYPWRFFPLPLNGFIEDIEDGGGLKEPDRLRPKGRTVRRRIVESTDGENKQY